MVFGCSVQKKSGETLSTSSKTQGLIEVRSKGYGALKSESIDNAIENAFRNILTKGIPQSNQQRPLLGNDAIKVFEKNNKYFNRFFEEELLAYVLSQKIISFNSISGSQASSEVLLEINLDALRKKLENDKIISTFGL